MAESGSLYRLVEEMRRLYDGAPRLLSRTSGRRGARSGEDGVNQKNVRPAPLESQSRTRGFVRTQACGMPGGTCIASRL